jgi:hypothetical protein
MVRILDEAVSPHQDSEMRRMVTNHGYLWLIDGPINGMTGGDRRVEVRKWYWCKPLASSGIVYDWNEDEFETAEQIKEQTDADQH